MADARDAGVKAEDEVVDLCRELIAIDTSNYGDHSGPGERAAAEYVAEKLDEVGVEPAVYESHPGRSSVVARIPGADPGRAPLLIHGHLDVVPADAADWTHHPFAGELVDGCVWGRGAVDMKDMDAMVLAVLRQRLREGRTPPRDIVLAFLADEEAGGTWGAKWLVDQHPELFADCSEAISEVGGFSVTVAENRRLYLIETAEKGIAWMRLKARGTAGHGSMVNDDNAVTELADAVARLGRHRFPVQLTTTVRTFLEEVCAEFAIPFDEDDVEATVARLGTVAGMIGATLRHTVNPTVLNGGYKANVIPGTATAEVDGRFLPGLEDEFFAEVDRLLGPKVTREFIHHLPAVETEFEGGIVSAMSQALMAEDDGAKAVPYCLSGGTDAKSLQTLGIKNYGFAPLRLPPELNFSGMFHGVDERVPVDGLRFGVRVLDRFIDLS
ncbi:M20/M25/M40 family metallo-hydrolase [Streptomonospora nanhaiensis]|uniref:Acetylornithine deacetylase/succinyl-diaminopimelate desuccinylase-like protein n=1 Tax=Streptomonospora nanhaiensis TaxID=1323731 RepID=A0A853BP92_9ACTN|nr:M20/M25/M40 family metallo-hydrolase [Streptomonospora nanhaiensis]MBX9388079.1 M20/M25/M40 family metallo-hydrolase [Streptomonospora nanhaiensis]NYI96466.1 acetylornithine deacetylase/succinyl-diaminopimelate desuccinylase-like protein [Streptomonospora nanhaiensis]